MIVLLGSRTLVVLKMITNDYHLFPALGSEYSSQDYCPVAIGQIDTSACSSPQEMNATLSEYIDMSRASAGNPAFLYGGYLERRSIYGFSNHFSTGDRNIHLAIDVWQKAGTPIYAAADGVVHSYKYNDAQLDYGYCLIIDYGDLGYLLYGHLAENALREGDLVNKGQHIADFGDMSSNGGWVTHLHLQYIIDMQGHIGDYPGVCSTDELDHYRINCPNPIDFIIPPNQKM